MLVLTIYSALLSFMHAIFGLKVAILGSYLYVSHACSPVDSNSGRGNRSKFDWGTKIRFNLWEEECNWRTRFAPFCRFHMRIDQQWSLVKLHWRRLCAYSFVILSLFWAMDRFRVLKRDDPATKRFDGSDFPHSFILLHRKVAHS